MHKKIPIAIIISTAIKRNIYKMESNEGYETFATRIIVKRNHLKLAVVFCILYLAFVHGCQVKKMKRPNSSMSSFKKVQILTNEKMPNKGQITKKIFFNN